MTAPVLRIHFLVPDDAGPVVSGPAGDPVRVSPGGRYRIACDPALRPSDWDRVTGEPWAVRCRACQATDAFRARARPKPGFATPDRTEETPPCGCG
jgi:hypothetical protein